MRHHLLRRPVAAASALTLTAFGLVALGVTAPAALADRVADAQQDVDRLSREAAEATEDYNEIAAQLGPLREQLQLADARRADQQRLVDELRDGMGAVAIEAFKSGGVDPSLALLTGNPTAYMENASMMESVSRSQAAGMADLSAALDQLAADRAASEATLAEIEQKERTLAATKAEVEGRLAAANTALQRAEADAAERAATAQQASRAGTGPTSAGPITTGSGGATTCGNVQAPTAKAQAAIEFACAQIGKPYQWAADGPGSYDCSGLTMAAYAAAGVSLPHSSRLQYSQGPQVSRSALQPGDLVFFYSPISHVGIYLGNGMMVDAPSSGKSVNVRSMSVMPFSGATRP